MPLVLDCNTRHCTLGVNVLSLPAMGTIFLADAFNGIRVVKLEPRSQPVP
jgi:hypothetical protein